MPGGGNGNALGGDREVPRDAEWLAMSAGAGTGLRGQSPLLEVDDMSEAAERYEDVLTASCNSAAPSNVPGGDLWASADDRAFTQDMI